MQCPVCGTKNEVGKLYEFVRGGKTRSIFYCSACSIEFSTVGTKVASIAAIDAEGRVKRLMVTAS